MIKSATAIDLVTDLAGARNGNPAKVRAPDPEFGPDQTPGYVQDPGRRVVSPSVLQTGSGLQREHKDRVPPQILEEAIPGEQDTIREEVVRVLRYPGPGVVAVRG